MKKKLGLCGLLLLLLNLWPLGIVKAAAQYDYSVVAKADDAVLRQGDRVILWVTLKNTGTATWYSDRFNELYSDDKNPVRLGTERPRDRNSGFYDPGAWVSLNRVNRADQYQAAPGEEMSFGFYAQAPSHLPAGNYRECFAPVIDGVSWLPDKDICWNIRVEGGNFSNYLGVADPDQRYVELNMTMEQIQTVELAVINTGMTSWYNYGANPLHLATTDPRDRNSDLYHNSWLSHNRVGTMKESVVRPGETAHFQFTIQAPNQEEIKTTGSLVWEHFWLVVENEQWLPDPTPDYPVPTVVIHITDDIFSLDNSSITREKATIKADGRETSQIIVTLRDVYNNPVNAEDFQLYTEQYESGTNNVIRVDDEWLTTNHEGQAFKDFSSGEEGDFYFYYKFNGLLSSRVKVTTYKDTPPVDTEIDWGNSYITSNKTAVKADGEDYATVKVYLRNADNDPIKNKQVELYGSGTVKGGGTGTWLINNIYATTNSSGVATFTYSHSGAADVSLGYKVDGEIAPTGEWIDLDFYAVSDGSTIQVPVLSLSYIPTTNGLVNTNVMLDVYDSSLANLRNKINTANTDLASILTNGSRFRYYKNSGAKNALDYRVLENKEFLKELPASNEFTWPTTGNAMIDYNKIMKSDIDVCDYVDVLGVKEIWIWGYAPKSGTPTGWESNMMMGRDIESEWNYAEYGNVSNSWRRNDMPICEHTYTAFTYNYGREVGMALEDHTHQIEAVLNFVDGRDETPGNQWANLLFWGKFVGSDSTGKIVRPGCGWTHYPPNGAADYDWYNTGAVSSDCMNWLPDGGGSKNTISCTTWGGSDCQQNDYGGGGVAYKVWWMQSIPGLNNGLTYGGRDLKNWWSFIGDFDGQIQDRTLVE